MPIFTNVFVVVFLSLLIGLATKNHPAYGGWNARYAYRLQIGAQVHGKQ